MNGWVEIREEEVPCASCNRTPGPHSACAALRLPPHLGFTPLISASDSTTLTPAHVSPPHLVPLPLTAFTRMKPRSKWPAAQKRN